MPKLTTAAPPPPDDFEDQFEGAGLAFGGEIGERLAGPERLPGVAGEADAGSPRGPFERLLDRLADPGTRFGILQAGEHFPVPAGPCPGGEQCRFE